MPVAVLRTIILPIIKAKTQFWRPDFPLLLLHRLIGSLSAVLMLLVLPSNFPFLLKVGKEGIHLSLIPVGVAVPDVLRPPSNASWASLSFCSRASARRFRKSESATSPTVWVLRRSSAVLVWEVKRRLGVEAPEGGSDDIIGSLLPGSSDMRR